MSKNQISLSILGFVPALVVQYLQNKNKSQARTLPEKQTLRSVVMFADISGFTNLTETLSKIGPEGAEVIAFAINRYMELLVKGIGRSGGDVFKFAGDAMIVVWPPPQSDAELEKLLKQAIQSALDLQAKLNDTNIIQNVKLSVKIGFGVGEVNIIHVGGVFSRTEYLATGDPLIQAFGSEHCATSGGQTIISQQVYEIVQNFFDCKPADETAQFHFVQSLKKNYSKVKMKADALLMNNNLNLTKFQLIKDDILAYIPAALVPYIEIDEERWSSELRRLTIVFVNLGIDLNDAKTVEGLNQIQQVISTVQKCVYIHEGSLNKLLMDDKGSTLIVVFGLPPMAHQDDSVRAIFTAHSLIQELAKINCSCSIGIATGLVFAGVVGTSGSRREYSVLGDSVNLAARLMGTACKDPHHKVIICEETANDSEHKIPTYFYKFVQLKGKQFETPLYLPLLESEKKKQLELNPLNQFPGLRTHSKNFPPFLNYQKKDGTVGVFNEKERKSVQLQIQGRDEELRTVINCIDRFIKGIDKKSLAIIRGTYGIGKTLLARKVLSRIQDKIDQKQYTNYKYGEEPFILIGSLNPISKTLKFNGVRKILKQVFQLYSQRLERAADVGLFNELISKTEYLETFKKCLGLEKEDLIKNFPQRQENSEKEFYAVKQMTMELLSYYFENVPEKYEDKFKKREWQKREKQQEKKMSVKNSNVIAPLIFCLDDMQNYDENSYKLIRSIIKNFDRCMALCLIRDQYVELPLNFKKKDKEKTQDDILIEGMANLEKSIDQNQVTIIHLRGMKRLDKEDDFFNLIRWNFNIQKFQLDDELLELEEPLQPKSKKSRSRASTYDISYQEQKQQQLKNYFLYHQNKNQLAHMTDPTYYLTSFLYLKTQGNSYMTLNYLNNLIASKYLQMEKNVLLVTKQCFEMLDNEETIVVEAPSDRFKINGPIIDKMTCIEQLLLKVASVIGDIFDIQTLNKINPFKVNLKLQNTLEDLQDKDILEVMEIGEYNVYYRFTHPFLRDCLYQRMTYAQRRHLHHQVAEAIQVLPQIFEVEEVREFKSLQFQWKMSEQTWTIGEDTKVISDQPRFNFLTNIFFQGPKEEVITPQKSTVSSKAIRSIILKQIQNKLARTNNDQNTIIKEGYLDKKSDSNYTWAQRYCVLTGREFRYYYSERDAERKENVLGSILLRYMYSLIPLNEKEKYNKSFVFQMSATSWVKRQKELGERRFFYSAENEEALEQWIIYLEFARAKALYDDFVNSYGKISFPIGSQTDYYDTQFKYDVLMRKRVNFSAAVKEEGQESKKSMVSRTSRASKFALASRQIKMINSLQMEQSSVQTVNNVQDIQLLKDRLLTFLQKSMLLCFSHLFDMAIQRKDEYKHFGQSNTALVRINHIFKIDAKLVELRGDHTRLSTGKDERRTSSNNLAVKFQQEEQGSEVMNKVVLEQIEEEEDEVKDEQERSIKKGSQQKQQNMLSPMGGKMNFMEQMAENLNISSIHSQKSLASQIISPISNQSSAYNRKRLENKERTSTQQLQPKQGEDEELREGGEVPFESNHQSNLSFQSVNQSKLSFHSQNKPSSQKESLNKSQSYSYQSEKRQSGKQNFSLIIANEQLGQNLLQPKPQGKGAYSRSPIQKSEATRSSQQLEPEKAREKSINKDINDSQFTEDVSSESWGRLNRNINSILTRLADKLKDNELYSSSDDPDKHLPPAQQNYFKAAKNPTSKILTDESTQPYKQMTVQTSQSLLTKNNQHFNKSLTPTLKKSEEYYALVVADCSTVAGEIFQLQKGQKILVYSINRVRQLGECSIKGQVGWVEMKNIAVIKELNKADKSTVYSSLIERKFNQKQASRIEASPLKKPAKSVTPAKRKYQ